MELEWLGNFREQALALFGPVRLGHILQWLAQQAQIGGELGAVVHFVLVDAQENHPDLAAEAELRARALFFKHARGTGADSGQRFGVHALKVRQVLLARRTGSQSGAQALGDARFVVREVAPRVQPGARLPRRPRGDEASLRSRARPSPGGNPCAPGAPRPEPRPSACGWLLFA